MSTRAFQAATHATRRLLRRQAVLMGWFWAISVVVVVIVTAILAAVGAEDASPLSSARQAGIWFPMSMQIVIATTYVRVHVATGMTRRSLTWAALVTAVTVAVGNATVMASLLSLERAVHGWFGWGWRMTDVALNPLGDSWPLLLLDYGLTYLVVNLCGLLVGIVYYAAGAARGPHAGGWWGTVTLPLTAGPILLVLALVAGVNGVWPDPVEDVLHPTVGTVTAMALALALAVAIAFVLIARRTAIARPRG